MIKPKTNAQNYVSSVEIAEGIYWVGFYDTQSGLHCNPYLILDHDEALVIDGGSRPDFASVMMKIMQTGIAPKQIQALVYQHYDPDLCGSIPNFEDIIRREDLKIISAAENLMFIRHYSVASRLVSLKKAPSAVRRNGTVAALRPEPSPAGRIGPGRRRPAIT